MSTQSTDTDRGTDAETQAETNRVVTALRRRSQDGTIAMVAGSALFLQALRTARRDRGRALLLTLSSLALVGLGLRQRRTHTRADSIETEADVRRDESGEKAVSDAAHVESHDDLGAGRNADESQSVYQDMEEPNPRGMSDRSDIEDEGGESIAFVDGSEPGTHREPHLEEEGAHDTRLHSEGDDEPTEVDLSEAAMADEASEATGPKSVQAYPAREGTDPEPTSENAPERVDEGATDSGGSDAEESASDEGDREAERT